MIMLSEEEIREKARIYYQKNRKKILARKKIERDKYGSSNKRNKCVSCGVPCHNKRCWACHAK